MKTRRWSMVAFVLLGGAVSHADERADALRAAQELGIAVPDQILKRPAVARELGVLTRAQSVKLRSLSSERVQIVIQVDDADDYGDGTDGLIGMSFLSRFDIALDGKTLRIRPRKAK